MAIKFEKVKVGVPLYSRGRQRMGNTTISTLAEWRIDVLEVDSVGRRARVSWNGNPAQWKTERYFKTVFDWSMHDDTVADVRKGGMFGDRVIKVTKKKAPKKEEK